VIKNERNRVIDALPQYKQKLDDALLEEACRQWCDFDIPEKLEDENYADFRRRIIEDIPKRSDGKGFAEFYREICDQNYYIYADTISRDSSFYYIGEMSETIRFLSDVENKLEGQQGQFINWVHVSYNLAEALEESPTETAKGIGDAFQEINEKYGENIVRDLYNSKSAVLPEEMLNAAEYMHIGGKLEHINGLCSVGFFMPDEFEQFGDLEKHKAIEYMNNGGDVEQIYNAIFAAEQTGGYPQFEQTM